MAPLARDPPRAKNQAREILKVRPDDARALFIAAAQPDSGLMGLRPPYCRCRCNAALHCTTSPFDRLESCKIHGQAVTGVTATHARRP
jgi:hypothetical protein